MNILPQQLKGKIVEDCYQDWNGDVVIVFTDGTKIEIVYNDNGKGTGKEISIPVIV